MDSAPRVDYTGAMSQAILVAAFVHAMATLAPPARLAALPAYPGWAESAEERLERYEGIASAAVRVAYDPAEEPIAGTSGRKGTAALLLGVAFAEGGFARDVDIGPCYRGRDGKNARCDYGRAHCSMQIQVNGRTPEGWTGADLVRDRDLCFRRGLHMIRQSAAACASNGASGILRAFASGNCRDGQDKSAERMRLGRRVFDLAVEVPRETGS